MLQEFQGFKKTRGRKKERAAGVGECELNRKSAPGRRDWTGLEWAGGEECTYVSITFRSAERGRGGEVISAQANFFFLGAGAGANIVFRFGRCSPFAQHWDSLVLFLLDTACDIVCYTLEMVGCTPTAGTPRDGGMPFLSNGINQALEGHQCSRMNRIWQHVWLQKVLAWFLYVHASSA